MFYKQPRKDHLKEKIGGIRGSVDNKNPQARIVMFIICRALLIVCVCVAGIEPRAMHMLGKPLTTKLHPQCLIEYFQKIFSLTGYAYGSQGIHICRSLVSLCDVA